MVVLVELVTRTPKTKYDLNAGPDASTNLLKEDRIQFGNIVLTARARPTYIVDY